MEHEKDSKKDERCKDLFKAWKARRNIMPMLLERDTDPEGDTAYYAAVTFGFAIEGTMRRFGCPDKNPS